MRAWVGETPWDSTIHAAASCKNQEKELDGKRAEVFYDRGGCKYATGH